MLRCVAPGCTYNARVVLMGMSLCDTHRDSWCQLQLSYYQTLPKRDISAYQEFMLTASQEYLEAHPTQGASPEQLHVL